MPKGSDFMVKPEQSLPTKCQSTKEEGMSELREEQIPVLAILIDGFVLRKRIMVSFVRQI
jgi:hypothetical protein